MGLFTRAIRPPDDITPNPNDPAAVPPSTVGPDQLVTPGDPNGVVVEGDAAPPWLPPRIIPSAWSGWPQDWWPPYWNGQQQASLTGVAWNCLDYNSSALSTMPAYLVGAASTLSADWLNNPSPDVYESLEAFLKSLFWDYQAVGEAFVLATARYATGWPARFHVVPPWTVQVELDAGLRRYTIGKSDVTGDILHIRYQGSVDQAHGVGPLQAAGANLTASQVLARYATSVASTHPPSILKHAEELGPGKAERLKQQWIQARSSGVGEPAVLEGGISWEPVMTTPKDMALLELLQFNEGRIASLLGVPAFLVNLPSGGDSMTYSNATSLFDFNWRANLRPKAQAVMSALSGWALPRGTRVELNRDEYVQPGPLERAQTAQILFGIQDPVTGRRAIELDEIRAAERLDNTTPAGVAEGVLR